MSRLPDRPRGVRRSWRKSVPDAAWLHEWLNRSSWAYSLEWGAPIEAAAFRCPSILRRVEILFAGGRRLSISFTKGKRIERSFRI